MYDISGTMLSFHDVININKIIEPIEIEVRKNLFFTYTNFILI
jgi:hypothetical protein